MTAVGTPAEERVRKAAHLHQRAQEHLSHTRGALHTAIVEALRAGVRQTRIVQITGYTRERVRQIARNAGYRPQQR